MGIVGEGRGYGRGGRYGPWGVTVVRMGGEEEEEQEER